MINYIKNNFLTLVIGVLLVIILLQTCRKEPAAQPTVTIIRDTTYVIHDSAIVSKPTLTQTIPYPVDRITTKYLRDTNYAALKEQFLALAAEHLATNIYKDTIKIDSIGTVDVIDTVTSNKLLGAHYWPHLTIPTITITKTIQQPYEARNQVFVGGFLQGTKSNPINGINGGVLLKNKQDNIYYIGAGLDNSGQTQISAGMYWKIKL